MDQCSGRVADNAIHSGMVGNANSTSMMRWITVSTAPPKYPEMPPMPIPSTQVMMSARMPIDSDSVAPCTMRGVQAAARSVGAEREPARFVAAGAEQMDVGLDQEQHLVRVAPREQPQRRLALRHREEIAFRTSES